MGVERENGLEGLIDKLWMVFLDKVRKKYLFSWDSVPGDDDEKLKNFLRDDLDIGWAEDVEINKSDDDKTICIFKDENSAEIKIDKKKEIATLKIRGGRTHDLIVKKEEGKLNIYGRKKKRVPRARSELGDEVDLFVPQIRALFLMQNRIFPKIIYESSCRGARRNTLTILDNVEMLPDLFCYLVYKKDDKSLNRLINLLFREIMEINKEGLLSVENVSTDPPDYIKIILKLKDCAECFGVKEANHPFCYYHAGMLTGIVSALWGKKLYGYETECCAMDGDECVFIIETNSEDHEKYLNPGKIDFSLHKRLEDTLDRKIHRSIGDEIDLRYYQLVILNSLIKNPKMYSESSHLVGIKYGKELASFLQAHYSKKEEVLFDVISHYYRDLKHLRIEIKKGADEIRAKEVAEISRLSNNKLFLGFLFGELEGLFSVIRKEEVIYEKKTFENDDLVITFKKQE